MGITVVNKYKITPRNGDVYIGRGSPLGNPFPISKEATRTQVIEQYKVWLAKKIREGSPEIIRALDSIARSHVNGSDVRLVCFCKPQACHGDHIRELIMNKLSQEK